MSIHDYYDDEELSDLSSCKSELSDDTSYSSSPTTTSSSSCSPFPSFHLSTPSLAFPTSSFSSLPSSKLSSSPFLPLSSTSSFDAPLLPTSSTSSSSSFSSSLILSGKKSGSNFNTHPHSELKNSLPTPVRRSKRDRSHLVNYREPHLIDTEEETNESLTTSSSRDRIRSSSSLSNHYNTSSTLEVLKQIRMEWAPWDLVHGLSPEEIYKDLQRIWEETQFSPSGTEPNPKRSKLLNKKEVG